MLHPTKIGPYGVIRMLGQGGMGVVFEVQDPQVPRTLALKLIKERSASRSAIERFWREAETLGRINHPNVVQIHKMGRAKEGPFILEELIPGRPLDAVLDDQEVLEPREAARILRDLAGAFVSVHQAGILHRDLKPANVLLRDDGSPVLLDFGLAREVDAETLTKTGQLLGTPKFMAPEQAKGPKTSELTAAVDIYGLGVILYTLLVGEPPFNESSLYVILRQVINETPRWPAALRPEVPADLDRICRVAMAKDPADRYPDAAALRADLDRFLSGESVTATEARKPLPLWLLGVVVLVLGLIGAGVLVATRDGPVSEDSEPEVIDTPQEPERGPEWERQGNEALPPLRKLRDDPAKQHQAATAWLETYRDHPQADQVVEIQRVARHRFPLISLEVTGPKYGVILNNGKTALLTSLGEMGPPTNKRIKPAPVELWDLERKAQIKTWTGLPQLLTPLGVSADHASAVVGAEGRLLWIDGATGRSRQRLKVPRDKWTVAVSRDDRLVAWQGGPGVQVVELESRRVVHELRVTRRIHTLCFSADGKRLYVGTGQIGKTEDRDCFAELWGLDPPEQVKERRYPSAVLKVLVSPRGDALAVGDNDGRVSVLDAETLELRKAYELGDTFTSAQAVRVTGLAYSPAGDRLYSTLWSYSKKLAIRDLESWDVGTNTKLGRRRLAYRPLSMDLSADGKRLLVTGKDRAEVWLVDDRGVVGDPKPR